MIPHQPISDEELAIFRKKIAAERSALGSLVARLIARIDLEQRTSADLRRTIETMVNLGKDA